MADAALSYPLARYDRDVARQILEEAAPFLLKENSMGTYYLLDAATVVDPHLAVRLIDQLPPTMKSEFARERVGSRLLRDWRLPPGWTAEEE